MPQCGYIAGAKESVLWFRDRSSRYNQLTLVVIEMAKKRRTAPRKEEPKGLEPKAVFNSPFKDLNKLVQQHREAAAPQRTAVKKPSVPARTLVSPPTIAPADEETLFREAFEGVRPIGKARAARIAVEPTISRNIVSEEAEVLAELSDLVSGQGNFELTETEEYLEGMRIGIDPRLVTRLRRGEFSVQAHIDLHGMIQPDAKLALTQFILDSVRKGHRAVLVVHGRGLRSPGGQPVLKHATAQWLSHGTIGGYVLAFATARAYDGGAGAVWVLLKRERQRAKFDVLQGAKRRD
jgi:DNA-nicking Smr family endonuclease